MADTPLDAAPDGIYHVELPERLSLSVRFLLGTDACGGQIGTGAKLIVNVGRRDSAFRGGDHDLI
jgi:hypothetical protein